MRTNRAGQHNVGSASALIGAAMAIAACQGSAPPAAPDAAAPAAVAPQQLVPGPEIDLGSARDRDVAFVAAGGAFRATAPLHEVRVAAGAAAITARGQAKATPLSLETTSIQRGEVAFDATAGSQLLVDSQVELDRGVAVEHLKNRFDGVEQSWTFARQPDGDGDLVIGIAVAGQGFLSETPSGLHFGKPGEIGFRYSQATWIDAAGAQYQLAPRWVDGQIELTVPADIVANAQYPVVLDPTVSAEAIIDNPVAGYTGAGARNPQVAFDGSNFLAVWQDDRDDRTNPDIWAVRVSAAGVVLDTTAIKINAATTKQDHPTVAWVGNKFLVVWENFTTSTNSDLVAATVTSAGVVTQLGTIASSANSEITPRLAARGTEALLVYRDADDVAGMVFNGTSFGARIAIAAGTNVEKEPVAATDGTDYLVAFSETVATGNDDVRGQLVTGAGALSGAVFNLSSATGSQNAPAIAYDGTNYDTVWVNNNAGINLYGARVSAAGAVVDTTAVAISTATNNQETPTIACTSAGCLVAWQDRRNQTTNGYDVYGQLLTTAYALSGAEFTISNANRNQFSPVFVTAGTDYFGVWFDDRDGGAGTILGARVTAAGAVTDATGIALTRGNNREVAPDIGSSGSFTLVAWTDSRVFGTDIMGARFNSNGSKLDSTAKTISNAVQAQINAAVAGIGANFVTVWSDARNGSNSDIYMARTDTNGTTLDASGVAVTTATGDQLVPEIATAGTAGLIVWQDRRNGNFDIYGALVDSSGAVTTPDIVICNATGDQTRPTVAYDSANQVYLVVWSDSRTASNPDIYGARVTTAGVVSDANGVAISSASGSQFTPEVVYGSSQFFVAWEDRRTDTNGDIYGARVTTAGALTVLDAAGIAVSSGTGQQTEPTVAALGANGYFVGWTDGRNSGTTSTDIYGAQVSNGGVKSGSDFIVSANAEAESGASARNVNATALVTYVKARPDLDTFRVQTRLVTFGTAAGQSCTSNAQCSTGFCVDSRCCDTACGNNSQTDCQACAYSKTLKPDGTCSPIAAGTICRNYANSFCDLREYCDGTSTSCPADVGRNQGLVCNSSTGAKCPSNAAPGPHTCP